MRYPSDEIAAIKEYFAIDGVRKIRRILKGDNGTSCYLVTLDNDLITELYIIRRDNTLLLLENVF